MKRHEKKDLLMNYGLKIERTIDDEAGDTADSDAK